MKSSKFQPILILALVTLSFFYPVFLFGKLPIPADTIIGLYHPFRDLYAKEYPRGIPYKNSLITDPVRQQYPWRYFSIWSIKNFNLPLWNPYNMSGYPLLANFQSAVFYPLNIMFLFSDFSTAWSLLILLQPLLAGLFMYLYLKNLRLNDYSCFLGGFTFAFCGFSIAWLEWANIVHAALWLPLLLLAVDKIINAKSKTPIFKKFITWNLIFLFSLASSFFAGYLQTFFYLAVTIYLYILIRWLQFNKSKKILFTFAALTIFLVLITSVQWIPTFQFLKLSARDIDQIPSQQQGWFLPTQHLIQFIAPDFFGNPSTLNYWGVWNYGEFIAYIGIFPIIMALFALFYRYDRKTIFFGSIFFISLIFALPNVISGIPFELKIPFLSSSQPTRLLFLTDFSLSVLTALGLDFFMRLQKKNKIIFPLLFLLFVYVGLWIFIYIAPKTMPGISLENLSVAKKNLSLPSVLFILISAALLPPIYLKQKKLQTALVGLLILITVFDLFRFSYKFIPFTDKEYLYPSTSVSMLVKYSDITRVMTTDARILPPNFSIMYDMQSIDGYDPLYLRRYAELIAAMERNAPDINPPFGYNRIINPHNYNSKIADLLGVRFIFSLTEESSPKLQKMFEEGETKVYENKNVFKRAFFVNRIHATQNKQQSINAMFDKSIDLKHTAIVEGWDTDQKTFIDKDNRLEITEYRGNKVTINTRSKHDSFLILTDTFYPTWHAKVCSRQKTNCKETKIYLSDYNFRGIKVPSGDHTVVFYNTLF